jgi:hypothetical protein
MEDVEFKYEVAFSFAGEDREYVEAVAKYLEDRKVKVFYDKFEEIDLWGKDLGIHFDYLYSKAARYCIPFISKHYKDKIWTRHEIRTAISKSIESNQEYILPARFDDTEIEGIRGTIAYINLNKISPQEFGELIIKKLGKANPQPIAQLLQDEICLVNLDLMINSSSFGIDGCSFNVRVINRSREYRYFNGPTFICSVNFYGNANAFDLLGYQTNPTTPVKLEYGAVTDFKYPLNPNSLDLYLGIDQEAEITAVVYTTLGEKFESNKIKVNEIVKCMKLQNTRF